MITVKVRERVKCLNTVFTCEHSKLTRVNASRYGPVVANTVVYLRAP